MPTFTHHDYDIRFEVRTTHIGVIVTFMARMVINYHGFDVVLEDSVTIVITPSNNSLLGE